MSTFLNLAGEDIVKINVGGAIYEAPFGIFENLPDSRLGKIHSAMSMDQIEELCDGYNERNKEFFFNHTCSYFRGILGCYYNEKLHLEETICVFDFKETLSYWGLSVSNMDSYCGYKCAEKKFLAMRDIKNHNKVVKKFEEERFTFSDWEKFRRLVSSIMEQPNSTKKGKIYRIFIVVITVISLLTLQEPLLPASVYTYTIFKITDAVALFVFSLDYIVRFCVAESKWKFFWTVLNFVDLLSIVPYLLIVTIGRLTFYHYNISVVLHSQPIRFTIRVFRILRICRHSYSIQSLMQTLLRSSRQLATLLLLCVIATVFFAGVIYYAERHVQGSPFTSIPESMWWSVVTITSVGYGDYTPVTFGGRFIGVLCIFFSLVFVSLPISIVTQSFTQTQNDELLKDIVKNEVSAYNRSKKHKHFRNPIMKCCIEYCLQLIEDHLLLNEVEAQEGKPILDIKKDEDNENNQNILSPPAIIRRPSELPHSFPGRITLNVGGTRFEILGFSLRYAPESRLALIYEANSPRQMLKYCDDYNSDTGVITFLRSPKFFDSIMRFYQTGKLHLTHCCVAGFREELDYWGIEEMTLEPCCRMKYFFHKYEMEQALEHKATTREHIARQNLLLGRKRNILWAVMENPQFHWTGMVYAVLHTTVILVDTTVIIMNSIPYFYEGYPIETGNPTLTIIEHVCVNLFLVDFIMRYCSSPCRKFFLSKLNILELGAIIPSFILMVMQQNFIPTKGAPPNSFMIFLQALRVSRVFMSFRYASSLRSLTYTLFSGVRDLFVLIGIVMITAIFFSNLIFYAEKFQNSYKEMPYQDALWWAVVTITTVGYGDVVPNSAAGKIVGGICVLSSLILISVPVSLIIVNFTRNYILTNQKGKVIRSVIAHEDIEEKKGRGSPRWIVDYVLRRHMINIGYKGFADTGAQKATTRKRRSTREATKGKRRYAGKEGPVRNRATKPPEDSNSSDESFNCEKDFRRNKRQKKGTSSRKKVLFEAKPEIVGDTNRLECSFSIKKIDENAGDIAKRREPSNDRKCEKLAEMSSPEKRANLSFDGCPQSRCFKLHPQDSSDVIKRTSAMVFSKEQLERLSPSFDSSVDYKARYANNLKECRLAGGSLKCLRVPTMNSRKPIDCPGQDNRPDSEKRAEYIPLASVTDATRNNNRMLSKGDRHMFPVNIV